MSKTDESASGTAYVISLATGVSGGISEPKMHGLRFSPLQLPPRTPVARGWLEDTQAPSGVCYISAGGCWGGISAHSRGGANTHSGGEIGRRGETRESTAPSVWRCPPRHHSLPAYCPQPTAKAIWPRCGSNLLRWRFANQAAPACYVASWANRTSGRPGNAHAAGAMTMEHAGCVENVR